MLLGKGMKLKVADVGFALAAGLAVILVTRVIEGVFNVSIDGVFVAVLSTLAIILVLRSRGAWPS